MGVALCAMYDPEALGPAEFTTNPDGRTVAAAVPWLDEIARAKRLPHFSRFIPDDAIEAFLANDPDLQHFAEDDSEIDESDLEEEPGNELPTGGPPELWFDPADGLVVLAGLIEALRTEPAWAAGQPDGRAKKVAACLERLRADLETAGRAGARFSLHYS